MADVSKVAGVPGQDALPVDHLMEQVDHAADKTNFNDDEDHSNPPTDASELKSKNEKILASLVMSDYEEQIDSARQEVKNLNFNATPGGHVESDMARAIWIDSSTTTSYTRNKDMLRQSDVYGAFGLCPIAYDYIAVQGPDVEPVERADLDSCWRASSNHSLLEHARPVVLLNEYAEMAKQVTDRPSVAGAMVRYHSNILNGEVIFEAIKNFAEGQFTEKKYSQLMPLFKLLGYASMRCLPPDTGLAGAASIPVESPLVTDGDYYPLAEDLAIPDVPVVNAAFISMATLNNLRLGRAPWPAGYSTQDIGSTIAIIPVSLDWVYQSNALLWWTLAQLEYPYRRTHRAGVMRDTYGDLNHNGRPFTQRWYPVSNLVSVPGIGGARVPPLVLFVLVEQFSSRPDSKVIHFPGVDLSLDAMAPPNGAVIQIQDIGLAVNFVFNNMDLVDMNRALSFAIIRLDGAADMRTAVKIWSTIMPIHNFPANISQESRGGAATNSTLPLPRYSSTRGYVSRNSYRAWGDIMRRSPSHAFVSNIGQMPSIEYNSQGHGGVSDNTIHITLCPTDQYLSLMVGALIMNVPGDKISIPMQVKEIVYRTTMLGRVNTVATHIIARGNSLTPAEFVRVEHVTPEQRAILSNRAQIIWGTHTTDELGGRYAVSAYWTSVYAHRRFKVHYPNNGQYCFNPVPELQYLRYNSFSIAAFVPMPVVSRMVSNILLNNDDHAVALDYLAWHHIDMVGGKRHYFLVPHLRGGNARPDLAQRLQNDLMGLLTSGLDRDYSQMLGSAYDSSVFNPRPWCQDYIWPVAWASALCYSVGEQLVRYMTVPNAPIMSGQQPFPQADPAFNAFVAMVTESYLAVHSARQNRSLVIWNSDKIVTKFSRMFVGPRDLGI